MQGVDMGYERTHSFQNKSSHTPLPTTRFSTRPFAAPVQMKPKEQQTPEELENEAFNQNKFEAFGLQLKEKSGTITPVEQERLVVLQAKMDDFWAQRQQRASRFGFDFSEAMPEEDLQAKSTLQSVEAIAQLRDFQEIANNSPQTQPTVQLQAMADNYSEQQQQPTQKKEGFTRATTSLITSVSSGPVVQRKVKIKGKKTKTYANFGAFQKSPFYETLMTRLAELNVPPEVIQFHLKQLFSTDVDFENEQHFTEALIYDIQHKSMPDQEHTLQEQYMTLYGWKKREAGKQPATATGADEREPETLKVYRTMKLEDWTELEGGNYAKLSGHLGDFKQAQNYLYRKSPEPKVLIEFTLHPGAERDLFSSGIMAFPDVKGKTVPNLIKSTLIKEGMSDSFAKASTNEGTAPDKVGVKSEGGEAGFSLGIGGGTSAEVFMGLVAQMNVIGRSEAE